MKHIKYLKYLVKHKWYVFVAGRKLGVPAWRLLIHDWTKFLPSEWFPYANYFYGLDDDSIIGLKSISDNSEKKEKYELAFNVAWNAHQKRNKHHFQYWILYCDSGDEVFLEIPDVYLREMAADWQGASRALTGDWNALSYYLKNRQNTKMNTISKTKFELLLCKKI